MAKTDEATSAELMDDGPPREHLILGQAHFCMSRALPWLSGLCLRMVISMILRETVDCRLSSSQSAFKVASLLHFLVGGQKGSFRVQLSRIPEVNRYNLYLLSSSRRL